MLGFSLIVLTICIFIALFFLLFTKGIAKKVQVSGIILSEDSMAVDIDLRIPNASSPGGMEHKGSK